MKTNDTVMVRYFGADHARRHVIQRSDGQFWCGEGWSRILDMAKIYVLHADAQRVCTAIQKAKHRGKPVRTFKAVVTFTLAADDVQGIGKDAIVKYIADAVRLDVENSVFGDGPVEGSYIHAVLDLNSLRETTSRRGTH